VRSGKLAGFAFFSHSGRTGRPSSSSRWTRPSPGGGPLDPLGRGAQGSQEETPHLPAAQAITRRRQVGPLNNKQQLIKAFQKAAGKKLAEKAQIGSEKD